MPGLWMKRTLVAGGAAVLVGLAAMGVAGAQQDETLAPTPPKAEWAEQLRDHRQRVLEAAAARLGVSADQLRQALEEARQEVGPPPRPAMLGPMHGWGGAKFGLRGAIHAAGETAAQAIGISVEQLREELAGQSLADVARAHGVEPGTVAEALKAEANARIDQAVDNGRLTAERAEALKQRLGEQIDQWMERELPEALFERRPMMRGQAA